MKNLNLPNHSSFLQFNETNLLFTKLDGVTYIAVKPICLALKVDYSAQLKRLKKHPILSSEYATLRIQILDLQGRDYTCIPEEYVYGWIFSMISNSPDLMAYQKTCYKLLYNHFHGVIGKRKDLLLGVAETQIKIDELKKELFENKSYKQLLELEYDKKILANEMKSIDKQCVSQLDLFKN